MTITIYHNPRCSKSRRALEILSSQCKNFEIIEYLDTPPTRREILNILEILQMSPRDLMRKNEIPYRTYHLEFSGLSNAYLIDKMIEHPILIERPIVLANGKAVIGRPPERIMEIL